MTATQTDLLCGDEQRWERLEKLSIARLQQQILATVSEAGQKGVSLDWVACAHSWRGYQFTSADRARVLDVLRRLGAEGLVESGDGGEHWRRVE